MSGNSSKAVVCFVAALSASLVAGCGSAPDGGNASVDGTGPQATEESESIGVAVPGRDGKAVLTWQQMPKGTIQRMIDARQNLDVSLEALPTSSVVTQCASTGGACASCSINDLWVFNGKWGKNGIPYQAPSSMICLRSTPWPWDYLPNISAVGGGGATWGTYARSVWGSSNSTSRFDCSQSVVDPRDGVSKVMNFVDVNEQVNVQCADDTYNGQTTWTRIPWG